MGIFSGIYQYRLAIVCQNIPITNHRSNIDFTLICHAVLEYYVASYLVYIRTSVYSLKQSTVTAFQ